MRHATRNLTAAFLVVILAWLISVPFSQIHDPIQSFAQLVYPTPPDESNENSEILSDNSTITYPAPLPLPVGTPINPTELTEANSWVYLPIVLNPYNRVAAVEYADRWAHDRNIYAFPVYSGDCTNFVSQILYAGGVPLTGLHYEGYGVWWYAYLGNYLFENSNTWSATDWLYIHASYYRQDKYQSVSSIEDLQPGDFFLMEIDPSNPASPDHARVAIGWGYVEEGDQIGEWRFLASQHTEDRKRTRWDYNIDETTPLWFFQVH